MKKKFIIFDFDGTLFDTRSDIIHAVNRAREKNNFPKLDDELIISFVGHGVSSLAEKSFADTPLTAEEAKASIMDFYNENPASRSFPYPGVIDTIKKLEERKLFIVSNKLEDLILKILKVHYPDHSFLKIFGGDSLKKRKPDPEAIHRLQSMYNCSLKDMVMIGDMAPDIQMAKNAGIDSIFCKFGFSEIDTIGATHEVTQFSEILNYI